MKCMKLGSPKEWQTKPMRKKNLSKIEEMMKSVTWSLRGACFSQAYYKFKSSFKFKFEAGGGEGREPRQKGCTSRRSS